MIVLDRVLLCLARLEKRAHVAWHWIAGLRGIMPMPKSSTDPSWAATRDDLRRLAWILALVWVALAAFTTLAQRYLGWRLAAGLIGGSGALFTIGLALVAGGSLAASSLERRWAARRERAERTHANGVNA